MAHDLPQNKSAEFDPQALAAWRDGGIELLATLGSGSSSSVYRARLLASTAGVPAGTEVAIKAIHSGLPDNPRARELLQREAELGRRVDSPNVARIHSLANIDIGGEPVSYLVMELIEGHTVRALLHEAGFAVEDLARRIGFDVATGLTALHAIGVIHRDLKPENLVLTPEGRVVIVDLGFARPQGTRGRPSSGGFFGSLAYAAPEILRGGHATPRSDLYALGVVLYEVATGAHPFAAAASPDAMIDAHVAQPPARPSHLRPRISALLEQLLLDLLVKSPTARPRSAAAVAVALAEGESSRYWRHHQRHAPALASRERLRSMRRVAPTALFGRHAERHEFDQQMRRALRGHGGAVVVTGRRGSGRRRLVDECTAHWLELRDDVVFLGGQADREAKLSHGAPFTTMLLDWFLSGDRADSPHVHSRVAARIRTQTDLHPAEAEQLAGILSGADPGDSPDSRADLIARALLQVSGPDRCTILRVDHAEELSPTGHAVVRRLLERARGARLLLVLVQRRPLDPPRGTHIALGGLQLQDFVALGHAMVTGGADDDGVFERAHAVLGGTPGLLLDALDDQLKLGKLRHSGPAAAAGGYQWTDEPVELRPPAPLLSRLRDRIADLPAHDRFVFQAAAVLGKSSRLADIVALTGQPELEALEALSSIHRDVIVAERRRVSFRHRDYRAAVLDTLPLPARQRLHRNAAWILEARQAPALEVGLHLSRAAAHAAAVAPLLDGLDGLIRAGSMRSGLRVADRIRRHLNALPRTRERRQQRLRYFLAAAQMSVIDQHPMRGQRLYRAALISAQRLDDSAARARSLIGMAEIAADRGHDLAALQLAESAEEAATSAAEGPLSARALALRARLISDAGDADAALELVTRALALTPTRDSTLRAHLLVDTARLEALRTQFMAALKNLDRAESMFRRRKDRRGMIRVHLHRGRVSAQLGDLTASEHAAEAGEELASDIGHRKAQGRALWLLGTIASARRQRATATALFVDALAAASAARDRKTIGQAGIELARAGIAPAALREQVATIDLPEVRAQWLLWQLSQSHSDRLSTDRLAELTDLDNAVTLPLDLHLRVLLATRRRAKAEGIAEAVARRLPAGRVRRQFLSQARRLENSPD